MLREGFLGINVIKTVRMLLERARPSRTRSLYQVKILKIYYLKKSPSDRHVTAQRRGRLGIRAFAEAILFFKTKVSVF